MDANNASFWFLLAPSIGALLFAVAGYIKAQTAAKLGEENRDTLVQVGKQFNGRLSQLMEKAEMAQRAIGVTEGQDKERSIQDSKLEHAALVARNVVADALVVAIADLEQQKKDAIQLKATAAALAVADLKRAVAARTAAAVAAESAADDLVADVAPPASPTVSVVRAAALDAVHAAVEHEIARTPVVAEVRKLDEAN